MRTPARTFFETILIIAVVIAFAVAPLAAEAACEGHHHGGHGPAPFTEFDTDGDGSVSEEEFNATHAEHMAAMAEAGRPMQGAASAPSFADADTDGDGKLTADELSAAHKAHMKLMRKQHEGEHHGGMHHGHKGRHESMQPHAFGDLDQDGDGCISPGEFDAHHAELRGAKQE